MRISAEQRPAHAAHGLRPGRGSGQRARRLVAAPRGLGQSIQDAEARAEGLDGGQEGVGRNGRRAYVHAAQRAQVVVGGPGFLQQPHEVGGDQGSRGGAVAFQQFQEARRLEAARQYDRAARGQLGQHDDGSDRP